MSTDIALCVVKEALGTSRERGLASRAASGLEKGLKSAVSQILALHLVPKKTLGGLN